MPTSNTIPMGTICNTILEVLATGGWARMALMHGGMSLQNIFSSKHVNRPTKKIYHRNHLIKILQQNMTATLSARYYTPKHDTTKHDS